MQDDLHVRQATTEDAERVVEFTSRIWTDRGGDYIPHIYHDWIAGDGDDQRTFVVDAGDGDVAGILQAVMLSEHEAWFQGMRVNPDYRGLGVAQRLNDASFDWAADQGATVGRIMVFSWNQAGLGAARAAGFDPGVEFRWGEPDPDPDALDRLEPDSRRVVTEDPDAAWSHWMRSDARDALGGLTLDRHESWACSELTRQDLHAAADETRVFAVRSDDRTGDRPNDRTTVRTTGMAFRVRDYDRPNDDGDPRHWAEYGVASWDDIDTARTLYAAIAEDAASLGADQTRVLIPETPRHVTDTAWTRAGISEEPDFVLERDLTDRR